MISGEWKEEVFERLLLRAAFDIWFQWDNCYIVIAYAASKSDLDIFVSNRNDLLFGIKIGSD